LWTCFLKHNPSNPKWFDRDRFVLSAGHGSMLSHQWRDLETNQRDGRRYPTPQLGEINTPQPMDAADGYSSYDGFMVGNLT
jgi:hypothetical protein